MHDLRYLQKIFWHKHNFFFRQKCQESSLKLHGDVILTRATQQSHRGYHSITILKRPSTRQFLKTRSMCLVRLHHCSCISVNVHNKNLCSFSTNSSCQLDILGHNGHSLCMNSTQVSVFKKSYQVGFTGFLQ